MKLTIAIPTWNNFKQLVDCLLTLTLYVEYPFKIVVINNGAAVDADGLEFEARLRKFVKYPHIEVIQAPENLGWQKAINLAFLEKCDTELFAMANDDLVFIPWCRGFLRQLCGYFNHPEIGAVGPSSNYVMGSQNLLDLRGSVAFETTLLIGFFMVVRSDVFAEVGGLDEGLPGGDDLDLSILIRKAGYRLLVDRSCYVHHIGSQTGQRLSHWNTPSHVDLTNNALIRKHGVRAWYETAQSRIGVFEPITQNSDAEGDKIREYVAGLQTGLDVGCGHNKTVATAVGVDKCPRGQFGVAGGRKQDRSTADVTADASDLPFDDSSQDYIIARHIFEHIIDPFAALDEWNRVLKPGGVLALACPDQSICDTMILDWSHMHAFTPESLSKLLIRAGFEVEDSFTVRPGFTFALKARKPDPASVLEAVS